MAMHCTLCRHPDRAAIEEDLASGTVSIRGIARRWEVGPEAVRRHVRAHLDPAIQEAAREVAGLAPVAIATRLLDVADAARDARAYAEETGSTAIALRAGDAEMRALLALADRLGVSHGDVLANLRDAEALADAMGALALRDRDAGRALAAVLDDLDRPDLAGTVRDLIRTPRPIVAITA